MYATDIDPHVYGIVCEVFERATSPEPGMHYPLPVYSANARRFAFELLMQLSELGYQVIAIEPDSDSDFA